MKKLKETSVIRNTGLRKVKTPISCRAWLNTVVANVNCEKVRDICELKHRSKYSKDPKFLQGMAHHSCCQGNL